MGLHFSGSQAASVLLQPVAGVLGCAWRSGDEGWICVLTCLTAASPTAAQDQQGPFGSGDGFALKAGKPFVAYLGFEFSITRNSFGLSLCG